MRLALAGLALAAASPALGQTFPLTLPDQCRQGQCIRVRYLDRVETARTPDGVLYRLPLRRWSGAPAPRGPGVSGDAYVFCSRTRPTYLFRADDAPGGSWIAHRLAPGHAAGLAGYNTASHLSYNAACHGVPAASGPRVRGLARRHGYDAALVDGVGQSELARPQDVLR